MSECFQVNSLSDLSSSQTYSTAAEVDVEIRLESYSNTNHLECGGAHCEAVSTFCDNMFEFCVREVGSSSCLSSIITDYIENDELTFSDEELETLGIDNPVRFSDISSMVSILSHFDV